MAAEKHDRGRLEINTQECKGCGLCIEACPPHLIAFGDALNPYGYRTAAYTGSGCTACGICFLACPEPGAITVWRARRGNVSEAHASSAECREAELCASN